MGDRARNYSTASVNKTPEQTFDRQRISVIMANFNGQDHIRSAIESVLNQTHRNLELIVSDDASCDDSCGIVREMVAIDDRVRLIGSTISTGPAGARNRALQVASGDWVCVVDSDDMIHPERLARMLYSALTLRSDIIADDLIFFGDDLHESGRTLFQDLCLSRPEDIDALALISNCALGKRNIALGYVKPLIHRDAIGDIRYNEELRVDEDHDFYLRLLLDGARFTLIPDAMYLYRRHSASVSHRFTTAKLKPMIRVQEVLLQELAGHREDLCRALEHRIRKHREQLRYTRAVEALKSRRYASALRLLVRHPRSWALLLTSIKERGLRRWRRRTPERKRMKLILCLPELVAPKDYPGFEVIYVPDALRSGWFPSAADTLTCLVRLSCKHELHITAIGRAGEFALGFLPRFRSARVVSTHKDLDALIAREGAADTTSGAEIYVGSA